MVERSAEFNDRLAELCRSALAEGADFANLLDRVEGADPRVVLDCLECLGSADPKLALLARNVSEEGRSPSVSARCSTLPIVHPLDYHWRFSPETIEALRDRISFYTRPGERVALLGAPSVHSALDQRPVGLRSILFDRDSRVVGALPGEARVMDLTREDPDPMSASCVLADPPWYPDVILAFARAAGLLLRPGGRFLLGFPAALTRPGVAEDFVSVRGVLEEQGFRLLAHEPLAVRYESPPFEQAAMAAANTSASLHWRRGDLLTFELPSSFLPGQRPPATEPDWIDFEIGSLPLRVNADAPAEGSRLIESLVPGDLLPSVSRRDPARPRVALWTSRNRVFSSADPRRLADLVRMLESGESPTSEAEQEQAKALTALIDLERREHGLPVRPLTKIPA